MSKKREPTYHYADHIETFVHDGSFPKTGGACIRRRRSEHVTTFATVYRRENGRWVRLNREDGRHDDYYYDEDSRSYDYAYATELTTDGIYAVELPDFYAAYHFYEVFGRRAKRIGPKSAKWNSHWFELGGQYDCDMILIDEDEDDDIDEGGCDGSCSHGEVA